jgi:hypothetical protein
MAIHTVGELRKFLEPFTDDCPITRNGEMLGLSYHSTVEGGGYLCAAEEHGVAALQSGEAPSQQPQLEMPCESTFLGWCGVQHYDQVQALAVYRYIAWHIKQVR